jgi:uncharacterized membrane protein YdjX (TVP38/TMEM64 family)
MKHLKKDIKRRMILALAAIIIVLFLFVQLEKFNDWFFVHGPVELKTFFEGFGIFSPVVFILIYIIGNMLLIPSIPFTFTSGVVYGLFWGIIFSLFGEIGAATVNFYIARKIKRRFFPQEFRYKKVQKLKNYIIKHGFFVIFIFRYLGFYFDVVSYAAGATKIRFKKFILATFIGFFPYIFLYVYVGNMLVDIKSSSFMYFVLYYKIGLFSIFILGYLIFTFIKKRGSNAGKK